MDAPAATGRRTIVSLLAAGAASGAAAGLTLLGLVEHGPEPDCAGGIEGLGCELAALAGMVLVALVLAAAVD